ncbi:BadF/BadG/BcrA/BcrD ATPase family protein [Streptomyces coeruleorubidus]|uniref:BadF/BadG/BcrA/BcrD ATPase family protein n=1 Tax=Streptomyces coeruleorubidus TaxID=116188 RepID=UPI00237FCD55|nr:BadF/BadG/BcrA/BcrD ATPase family protein [Streptomyces coeruleorubidus]WDV55216.1 BadF/BadG/BcrA/BcrD ATPase family protein [Streptomyces coeruleorubidus]
MGNELNQERQGASALVIGLDAGGTRTRAVLATAEDGCPVGEGAAGPGNALTVPVPQLTEHLAEAVGRAVPESVRDRVVAVAGGFAGATDAADDEPGRRNALAALTAALRRLGIDAGPPVIGSDIEAAFASAPGTPADGLALVAGTGAVAMRITGRRGTATVDGDGWLLGDDGSGFWIGRAAVRAALRMADGRGAPTVLAEAVGRELRVPGDALPSGASGGVAGGAVRRLSPDVVPGGADGASRDGRHEAPPVTGPTAAGGWSAGSGRTGGGGAAGGRTAGSGWTGGAGAAGGQGPAGSGQSGGVGAAGGRSAGAGGPSVGPGQSGEAGAAGRRPSGPGRTGAGRGPSGPAQAGGAGARAVTGGLAGSPALGRRPLPPHDDTPWSRPHREAYRRHLLPAVMAEPPVRLARLAPLVVATARDAEDPVALAILDEAADQLTETVRALDPVSGERVVATGGLLGPDGPLTDRLEARLHALGLTLDWVPDGCRGAVALARLAHGGRT